MSPKFMRIIGDFSARGGIPIKPLAQKFADDVKNNEPTRREILEMVEGVG